MWLQFWISEQLKMIDDEYFVIYIAQDVSS